MVGLDGRPTGKNLREILSEWLQFRFTTVTRRTAHRLTQVLDRIHVLDGRMIVLLNVDKVIKIIRNAEDPKADLIKAFKLSERQAEDILEMRLRMLAKLEHIKIEQELAEKRKEQKQLEKILGSRKALEDLVVARDRGGRQDLRRQAPHQDRGGGEGRARDAGDRRAGDRDLLAQGLGARAPGLGGRSDHAVVQGRRRPARAHPGAHRRSGRVPRFQGSCLHGRGLRSCRQRAATVRRHRRWSRCRRGRTSCTWSPASRRPTSSSRPRAATAS